MFDALASFLPTYLLHSSALIGLALALERLGLLRRLSCELSELVWRWALFGGLLTAGLQPLLNHHEAPSNFDVSPRPAVIAPAAPPVQFRPEMPEAPRPVIEKQAAVPYPPLLKPLAGLLTILWLLGAGSGLAVLLLQRAGLARTVRRLPMSDDAALQGFSLELCRQEQIKPPRIRVSRRWASPLVTPGGDVCLPLWAQHALSATQRQTVLAHELAHLQRRDPAWRFAGLALSRLAWLQPLNRLALQRLDTLAELACDDWAARKTGQAHALAESLVVCAEQQAMNKRSHATPRLAAAMNEPRRKHSPVIQRMQRLINWKDDSMDEHPQARRVSSKTRWLLIGGALLLAAVALPAIVIQNVRAEGASLWSGLGGHFSSIRHLSIGNNSITRIETDEGGGKLKIQLDGTPKFNADENDLLSLDGALEIDDKRAGKTRHLLVKSDGKTMARTYERDGQTITTLDAEDRLWMADVMHVLIDAMDTPQERVARLIKHGGLEAVYHYIETSNGGDYARRVTMEALLERGTLEPAGIDRILALTSKFNGDFEHRSALQTMANTQTLSDAQQQAYLQSAMAIGGSFERREALLGLGPKLGNSPAVLQAWVGAVKSINSDFEARTVLEGLLDEKASSPERVDAALSAADGIRSDFEHRSALQAIAPKLRAAHPAQFQAYAKSAAQLSGAFERREALVTLLELPGLDQAAYMSALNAAEGLGSSFEMANVLQAAADHMPNDAALIARYRQLARGLSDFERGRAERALDRLTAG